MIPPLEELKKQILDLTENTEEPHENHEGACEESPEGVGENGEGTVQEQQEPSEQPAIQIQRNVSAKRFSVTAKDLRRNIVINEILGKPVALRKK